GGTATQGAGEDYVLTNGTLTFAAGDVSEMIDISILEDLIFELDETITLNIQNVAGGNGATIDLANDDHTVTIEDDDSQPEIQFQAAASDEFENVADGDHRFNVILTNPSYQTITVEVMTVAGGTAEAGDITFASP